jgi:hypothetical protein
MLECAVTAVTDNLSPHAVGMSCFSTYSHALLLGLADPCAMSVKQIELTDRWLAMWARKVFPYVQQRETEGPVILIDVDAGTGATLAQSVPRHPEKSVRFGYPAKLATSVRGRLKRLQTGSNPAELQLGHDCSIEQCTALLGHLDAHWYQLPRRATDAPASSVELCAGGLPAAYFRVCGRSFERRDPAGRLTFEEAQQLQTIGAIADYDRGREEAEREWAWERWQGAYEWREASLTRTSDAVHRWSLEQLAIARSDGRIRVGCVTRVALGTPTELALSLRLWSGAPKAIALLPLSAAGSEEAPSFSPRRLTTRPAWCCRRERSIPAASCARSTAAPSAASGSPGSCSAASISSASPSTKPSDRRQGARARLRGNRLRRCRTASRARPAPTCCSTPTTPWTGIPGARRRSRARAGRASRSCCRSAIPRATGAT